ncbi:MAG TPA: lysophospholipid acyltransferase family protein [Candidatus Polarisedimenticolia bacterium]|nr:lysophospholipid acyltransferase family protein [Candidatus Polarisedimenticolia bacterium]
MPRLFLLIPVVVIATLVLGTLAIAACLVVPGGRALMPLARLWSRLVLWAAGVSYEASYDAGIPRDRPAVYASNHQSLFDIPVLVLTMPVDFRMVAKKSLLYVPVFGWALWLAGFLFIDRSNRERAIRTLDQAAGRLRRGTSIVVFAEGTRSPDGTLLPFKRGGFVLAIQAGVPVIPVSLRGGNAILPKGSLHPRPGRMQAVFGAPVDATAYRYETRDDLVSRVRDRIGGALAGLAGEAP